MNYLNARIRSLRSLAAGVVHDLRELVARWQLRRVGHRALGGIPRPSRRRGPELQSIKIDLDERTLASRILRHVDDCVTLQNYARELDICPDVLPAFRLHAQEADELAFLLSLYPNWNECSQLSRAHGALTRYWASAWVGGISDTEYRCALKSAALFLRQRCCEAAHATLHIADDCDCGIMQAY